MRNFFYILKTLGVKCSFDYTRDLYFAQEKNHSLWGVKKLLEHYGVKVTPILSEAKSIDALDYPFVCQTKEGMMAFTRPPKDIPAFLEQWDGYALLCDASHAKEPHYIWHKLKECFVYGLPWVTLAGVMLTSLCFLWEPFSLSRLLLVLFNALGFYFSYRSAVGECAGSCSVVTESPAGKLFGYSLSVIGVAYFGVSLLPTLFIPAWMHVWNWIAIVALLMPVWSIAHQAFVLHAWCKNCMAVQLMVILSAIVVMTGDFCSWKTFSVQSLVALPSFYLLAVYLLDMAFEHYKIVQHPPMDSTVLQLMRNPVLREEILRSGKKVDASEVPDVWVMNPKGEEELFLAISLHCVHCKEQFFKLYKAMEKGELKKYCIRIAISPSPQDTKVIEALAAIAIHESTEKSIRMLAEWYETQNRKLFLMSVKKDLPMEGVEKVLDTMNKAVERLDINGLPAMSLGGYEITPTIFWAKVEWDSLS